MDGVRYSVRGIPLGVLAFPIYDRGRKRATDGVVEPKTGIAKRFERRLGDQSDVADIYGWFTEGFDTGDLKEAKALLEEPSG